MLMKLRWVMAYADFALDFAETVSESLLVELM
jgi:hypothetical protein